MLLASGEKQANELEIFLLSLVSQSHPATLW